MYAHVVNLHVYIISTALCFCDVKLSEIYKRCVSPELRRALFSATYAQDVERWCTQTFDNVVQVYIGEK